MRSRLSTLSRKQQGAGGGDIALPAVLDAVLTAHLILFGAEPQVLHAQHRVLIDGWIEMRVSPRSAVLFKALRHQLSEYLRARIGANVKLQAADDASAGVGGGAAQAAVLDKIIWLISRGMTCSRDEEGEPTGPAGRGAAGTGREGGPAPRAGSHAAADG